VGNSSILGGFAVHAQFFARGSRPESEAADSVYAQDAPGPRPSAPGKVICGAGAACRVRTALGSGAEGPAVWVFGFSQAAIRASQR
jgi:hypothetical protein